MDLDEAFDLVIERARNHYIQLKLTANPQCVDDQSWLSAYDTAINIIEEHWDQLP
tara:strand:+ start:284 stop:448 length:165 start_codon:yes stop_codon:yes gene_type:complete